MDDEKQRAIAAEGGRAAHAQGTAHEFTSEEAREAGRKGGQARENQGEQRSSDRDMQAGDRDTQDSDNRSQQAQGRERDEQGQFTSDDDRSRGGRSNQGNSTI
jgi:hypothetical protein